MTRKEAIELKVSLYEGGTDINNCVNSVLHENFPGMAWYEVKKEEDWVFARKLLVAKTGQDGKKIDEIGKHRVHYVKRKDTGM